MYISYAAILVILAFSLLIAQTMSYQSMHYDGRSRTQQQHRRTYPRSYGNDGYAYTSNSDVEESNDGSYYDDTSRDYRNTRDAREEHYSTGGKMLDLSEFSDAEVSSALSMLSEHELDQLSRLMDDEGDSGDLVMKREAEDSSLAGENESDQVASIMSWFSRSKTTKATRKPTVRRTSTQRPTARRVSPRPATKATRRMSSTRTNKRVEQFVSDNNSVLRYGSDSDERDMVNRNVQARINFLKNKFNRHSDRRSAVRPASENSNQDYPQLARNSESEAIRRKRSSQETRGTLEDSFPNPNQATASLHSPMEPLVRVKRNAD